MHATSLRAVSALVTLTLSVGCAVGDAAPAPAEATATAPPTTGAPVSPAAPASVGGGIPPDVRLPDEGGGRDAAAEFTAWTTDEAPARPWLLDACRPTTYPTDAARLGFRTVWRAGPEAYDARQLAVYPSVDTAVETVAGFRRALEACRTGGDPAQGSRWQWAVADPVPVGDDAFLAASTTGGPEFASDGERIAVTRVGSMVFLAYARGEWYTAEIDDGAGEARRVAERFVADR